MGRLVHIPARYDRHVQFVLFVLLAQRLEIALQVRLATTDPIKAFRTGSNHQIRHADEARHINATYLIERRERTFRSASSPLGVDASSSSSSESCDPETETVLLGGLSVLL